MQRKRGELVPIAEVFSDLPGPIAASLRCALLCFGARSFSRNDDAMPKPNRWSAEKRYEIVLEMLRGKESIAQIARSHKVSTAALNARHFCHGNMGE